jgi:hypothetical protein
MRFDSTGFDPEACAAIAATLPPDADADAVINALEWIAHNYRSPQRDPAAERKRHKLGLAAIEAAGAYLRHERKHPTFSDDRGVYAGALEALGSARRVSEWTLRTRQIQVRARSHGTDPSRELLYASVLKVWIEAGGKTGISVHPITGAIHGPVVNFLRLVGLAITGKAPSGSAVRRTVKLWEKSLCSSDPSKNNFR